MTERALTRCRFDVLAYVSGKGQEGASRVFYGTLAFDLLVLLVNFVLLCIDVRLSALPVIVGAIVYDVASLKQLFVRRRNDKVRWDSAAAKQFSGLTRWVLLACFSVLLMTATQASFDVSSYWIKYVTACLSVSASPLFSPALS